MSVAAAVLLGILQGLTEFLPVSSSAHLILARAFFGWDVPADFGLAFDVALHIGTLAAIVLFFRRELASMVAALPSVFSPGANPSAKLGADPSAKPGTDAPARPGADASARLVQRIVVGTVPVVVVGLLFNDYIEQTLRAPLVAAWALAIGAVAMFAVERLGTRHRAEDSVTWFEAVLIGCAQACALIPGVSRSGATISVGMFLGLRRDAAARFTFLLAIPATLAAAGKESLELGRMGVSASNAQLMVVGVLVSGVVGYLTIKYFLRFLAGHRLDIFAYYRWALAAVTFGWLFLR